MSPWLHTCEQCGGKSYFQISDMLLPQVVCSHCGYPTINSPETIARTRVMLDETNWYAGFLELLLGLENELDIEYKDDDFPQPFVTWRRLLELTIERCGAAVQEENILATMAELSSCSTEAIMIDIDQAISFR